MSNNMPRQSREKSGTGIYQMIIGTVPLIGDNLNYPKEVQFTNGNRIQYIYSPDGQKLRATWQTAVANIVVPLNSTVNLSSSQISSTTRTDYIGNVIYTGTASSSSASVKLSKYLFEGGYATVTPTTQPVFHYFTQDHLGNNRAVVSQIGTVEQITHYYPFGGFFADQGTNSSLQPYKYNGKELDRMHGLDLYDYGARQYDPIVPMFTQQDPMAEKYYHLSPYAYCANNPVRYIDEHGDSISITGIIQYGKALNTNILQSVISDWQTISGLTLSISENGNIDYAKDENGKAIVSSSQKNGKTIENGSQAARDLLIKTIDAKETITFQGGRSTANVSGTNMIGINLKQMTALINGTSKGLDNRTMGWGMTLLHEMLHTSINENLKDDISNEYSTGPVVDYMNIIRTQLNNQGFKFGIRKQYMAFPYGNKYRIKFSKGQYIEF
ncbi:MAG: RHS repeat-associated core domain-containing protein [Prevotella sp.]|nr:RHS repeat-associated core domain-containing protein [Prevotella sp.]